MEFDTSFWVQIVVYALSFGAMYGTITQRLKNLEKTVAKHNSVVERTYTLEESVKSAWKRIDEIKVDVKEKK